MPINDYNRALSSNTPFADQPKPNSVGHTRYSADILGISRSGQIVTPSRLYEPTKTPGYTDWTGLRPRPASSHARGSGAFDGDDNSEPIGFAVTSGSNPHRRSRSLGHWRGVVAQYATRRRSDEIRYWRESYDPDALSPMSSQRPETQGNDKPRETVTPTPEIPQPFNFGLMNEMAGMKITQAASLEERVSGIERRLREMERAFADLHGRKGSIESSRGQYTLNNITSSPQTSSRSPRPLQENSRPSTVSTEQSQHQSYEELSPRPTLSLPVEQTKASRLSRNQIATMQSESMARPLSTSTTIRANASSSPARTPPEAMSLSKTGTLTAHHYSALLNLIEAEQTARQTLEIQVTAMRSQVQSLLLTRAEEGKTADSTARPDSGAYPAGLDTTRAYSPAEEEGSSTDTESAYDDRSEIYETPQEERSHYVTQEEYEHEITGTEHHANPRTMSLSQLTMGKNTSSNVGF
jgi:hypothetical protein